MLPRLALPAAVAVATLLMVYLTILQRRRRRRRSTASYGEVTVCQALQSDLPHLVGISQTAGQNIVPADAGGGDFVIKAWEHEWWTLDPRIHWNDFAFIGDEAVGFARVEAYGPPDEPESGWLMAMRVKPLFQGRRVMARLQAHLLARLPHRVRLNLYLAVGSSNERMRAACDPKYDFYGAYVLQNFMPTAMLRADRERYAAVVTIHTLGPSDRGAAWAFLAACLEHSPTLLIPGRYYDFRALTPTALDDKMRHGRALCARDGSTIVALFFEFDNRMPDGTGWRRVYTCCASASLDVPKLGSVLLAFGRAQPTVDAAGVGPIRTQLSVGPCIDRDGRDVEPKMSAALAAGNYTRPRSTHLRVYKVTFQPRTTERR